MPEHATALIGTSGWSYKHWEKGMFYPQDVAGSDQLPFYTQHFATVEINYSYYQLPERRAFETWRRVTPDGFLFAVKASRYLTHMKKLNQPAEPLQRLLDHASGLEGKLGPILFQFPRMWGLNLDRLTQFMVALRDHPQHRYAFEFRHSSWLVEDVFSLLRANNAALCLPIGWDLPLAVQLTSDWTYLRFHAGQRSITFGDDELHPWAERLRAWRNQGIDSYSYFNNDTIEHDRPPAIDNARRLRELVQE
jgi:uncharacterized protein YecE (DUF72 family)